MKLKEKLKGNKKTLKRIAACVLAVTMLPFSDIAQADIISMVKQVYADAIRAEESLDADSEEKQEEEIKIIKLSGQIDDTGNVNLSWYQTQGYKSCIYRIYRNGNMLAQTSTASYEDCNTKAGEVYHYEIRVYQQAEDVNPEVPDNGLRELGSSNKIDIQMPVALVIDGDYVLDKKMKVYSLDIKSGCLDLNGYSLEVCKNVTTDGRIKFNKGTLICNSDIRFEQNASCDMKYRGDCLYVKGDFVDSVYDREVHACFGSGEIQVIGNFTANYGMYFGNDLSIEFRGAKKQVIAARENIQSRIYIKNYSSEGCFIKGLHKNSNFDIDSSCKVTWMEQEHNYVSGFTVTEDRIIEDNLYLGEGILNLEGHTLTVKEDFECNGAEINLNGGTLIVGRDMLMKEGNLNINNGRLIVKGNFSYGELSGSNTEPDQNRTWSMLYDNDYVEVGGYASLMADDKIELSAGSINIAGGISVNGNLNIENHIHAGSCSISGGNITISGQMETDACFYNNDGGIVMNKGRLVVYGFYGIIGMISSFRGLKMSNPEDYVCIYGDFNNEGVPYDAEYAIRSGTLELKGRNNKVAGYGDSKVIVSGDTKQSISGIAGKIEIRNSSVFDVDVTGLRMYADYYDTELSYKGVPLMTGQTLTSDMTIDGSVGMPEGVLDLNGYTLTINGTFYHLGGTVRLNGGRLNITEDYNIEEGYGGISPLIVMEQSADYLMIGGSLNVPENEQCTLSDGVTEIKGDITGEGIIRSEQNHKVRLSGDKEQKITINRNSSFNVIEAENESKDGISMDRGYTINQFVRKNSGKIQYKDGIVGWTLKADEVYEGSLCISDGVLDLNGHTLRVKGSFIQNGGSIVTNNGTLIVEEDYTVSCMKDSWYDEGYSFCEGEKGNLTMQGKDSKIMVKGRVNINIETEAEWKLEAGRFCVGVDFYIASQPKISYSENFAWCLDGSIKQDISSRGWFYIDNIIISGFVSRDDASAANVTMHDNIRVRGKIESNGRYVENFRITDTAVFMDENFFGEVVLLSDYVINDTLVIKGKMEGAKNLTVNGKLKLDGNLYISSLVVNGTVEAGDISNDTVIVNGKLRAEQLFNNKGQISLNKGSISAKEVIIIGDAALSMNHADTYIEAEDFMCETKEVSELTEGFIRLTGHAQLNSNFITSGNNRMILEGKNSQAIRASEPVIINHLEIKQSSLAGVFIDIPVQINRITGNSQNIKQAVTGYTLYEDIVIDGDLYFHTGYINLNGHKMQVNGDFIHTGGDVGTGDGELNIEGNYYTKVPKEKKVDAPVTVSSSDVYWVLFTGNINIKGNADLSGQIRIHNNGTVTVGGNLRNYESDYGIHANTVVFTGEDIELDGDAVGLVSNLVFRGRHVELKSDLKPGGSIDPGTAVFQNSVCMSGFHQLKTDTINADVVITGGMKQTLDRDITVNGNLTLETEMMLGGHTLTAENIFVRNKLFVDTGRLISRNNIQVGYGEGTASEITKNDKSMLIMQKEPDYVLAEGNFTTSSRVNHYGCLTAGTLEVRGDFKQTEYGSNFAATGTHKTILSRKMAEGKPYVQNVHFTHPYSSGFQTLILTRRQDAGYCFNTDVHNICRELTLCYDDGEPPSAVEGLTASDVSETSITITYDKAEDNINLLGYYIYRDGEKIADVKADITKYTDTDLDVDTSYSYEVYAYDDCDNVSETSPKLDTRTKADMTPPSVPTACSVVKRTGSSITLRWNPSVDNIKVAGYELYRNGEKIADITDGVSYKDTGLKAGTAYEYSVKAYDTSGNVSTFGNSVQTYVAMPEITRITPADNSSMGGNSVTLTLFAGDKGSSEGYYAEIYYRKKGGEFKILCESLPIRKRYDAVTFYENYTWDISTLSDSTEYDIKCIIYDEDGNHTQKTVTFLLDREAPKKPKNVSGLSDNGVNIITFDASVSADCMGYHVYRKDKNSNVFTKYDTITGQYAVTYTDRNVIPGETYTYAVSAYDRFDNESALTETVMIQTGADYKKPEITGIAPGDKVISGIVNINVSATDNIGVESIKLWYRKETDGNETENNTEDSIYIGEVRAEDGMASFSFDTAKLPDGAYIFAASAVDTSGNESDRSYTRRYETDNTGIGKIELTDCASSSTSVQLRWKDVEETDFAYFLVERVWKPDNQTEQIVTERIATVSDTLGYVITGLKPDSTYAFWVVGYDKLGNRGTPSDICEITTQSDNIRPVISSILPVQSRYRDTLSLAMEVSDNDAVDRGVFSYSLDGENFERIAEVEAENKYTQTANTIKYEFNLAELPEGTLYIRFEAYDIAGNKNAPQKDGTDITAKYIVDRTPPSTAQNLYAEGGQGYVMLGWEQGDEDAASYTICRAEGDTEDFQIIAQNHGSMNYYDTAIVPGKTYRYKVAAADIAGNMGDYTQEVTCSAMKDEECPQIMSMLPDDGSIVGKNPNIKVFAADNTGVSKITAEYRRAEDKEDIYRIFAEAEGSERSLLMDAALITDGLADGDYIIRAYCEDIFGNISKYCEKRFTLDSTAPDKPELVCESGGYQVDIKLKGGEEEDFSHYKIYRAELSGGAYSCIAETSGQTYTDMSAKPGILYCYKAEAYDIRGNYSVSDVCTSYATDEDTKAPTAILSECITTLEGYEIALDGTASTDNVRITEYEWNMGNGDIIYGAQPVYTYDREGMYTVILTVKDAAGNQAKASMAVQVLCNDGNGIAVVTIKDICGNPIAYADAYMKASDGTITSMKADGAGTIQIAAAEGSYEVAAYKNGYLPNDKTIILSRYEDVTDSIILENGDLIVGDLKVEKMTLQDMIDSGVNLSDPANMNIFVFTVTVKLEQTPVPQTIKYVGGNPSGIVGGGELTGSWDGNFDWNVGEGSVTTPPPVPQAKLIDEEQPIIAIIKTTQTVSWLKEMYNVNLSILNAADSKFVIQDSVAELTLPQGVSLAALKDGQSPVIRMGDIAGQQQKNASWVVRGDRSGTYKVSADFSGSLMPFNRRVSAHFEAENQFEVSTGEGMHIIIYPQESAQIDENYYIQFAVINESKRNFYNFTTTLGMYSYEAERNEVIINDTINGEVIEPEKQEPKVYHISSGCTQMPVLQGGDRITIPVLTPGETVFGTYYEKLNAPGEAGKVYYKLIETLVSTLENDITGVKISIQPIKSHITKSIVNIVPRTSFFGDPVDLSTGAFTDSIPVISVAGAGALGFTLEYNSLLAGMESESGSGFYNNTDTRIVDNGNALTLYLASGISGTFVHADSLSGRYNGSTDGNAVYLYNDSMSGSYVSLSSGTEKYSLTKNEDGTYTVLTPANDIYRYDSEGRVVRVTEDNGRETVFSYTENTKIMEEPVSGKRIHIVYDENGMVSLVTDENGRSASFAYTDGKMTAYTNVLNETTTFTYDEAGRIRTETDCEGVTFVTNTYDEKGRVIRQSDAEETKQELRITYEETNTATGTITTVTAYDALGNSGVVVVDEKGRIVKTIDSNGGVTQAGYDDDGNEIFEADALGGTVITEYDEQGRKIKVTDQSGNTMRFSYDERDNLISITDGEGKSSRYEYNEKNLLTRITDYGGSITEYEYNEDAQPVKKTVDGRYENTYEYDRGILVKSTDSNGNATTYEYDGTGTLIKKTDVMGNTTSYTHDAMLRITTETNALGGIRSYTYDKYGNTLTETDELGRTVTHEYDCLGRKSADIMPDKTAFHYSYDDAGRLTAIIQPDGTTLSYTYDANGNMLSETNELGETITYEYDALNQKISETGTGGNTIRYGYYPNGKLYVTEYPDGGRDLYTYDNNWRLIRRTDAADHSVTYLYDDMGRIKEERDALGGTICYEYDGMGRLLAETDKNGNRTAYTYDGTGNCLTKENPDGTVLSCTYDRLNRLISAATIKEGKESIMVSYEYDALGRVTAETDEEGGVTRYEYDACGNLIKETDPLGNTVTHTYDGNGNRIKSTDAMGTESTCEYNHAGQLTKGVHAVGTTEETITTYRYDGTGRLLSVTDPLEGVTACTYDKDGNINSVTDALGGTTTYEYDSMGRVTGETGAIGNKTTYAYNAAGLLEREKNARKQNTEYTYDALGRIIRMEDNAGIITYEYDANGNVLTVTEETKEQKAENTDENTEQIKSENTEKSAGTEKSKPHIKTITRTYDSMNRVSTFTDSNGKTIKYEYDELGNRISLTYPGGEAVRYTYYASGRMKSVTDSKGRVTYYTYDKAGNLTCTDRPDGTRETNEYNAAGQVTARTDIRISDGAVINEYHYEYDARGNIVKMTGTGIEGISEAGDGICVSEDGSVRVPEGGSVGIPKGTAISEEEKTEIQRESKPSENNTVRSPSQAEQAVLPMSGAKMEYDADNRLIKYNGEEVKYDADGNMTYGPVKGEMTELVYDCRNRLLHAGNVTYEYDAENTRTAVITEHARTEYVTDVAAELSQVLEAYTVYTDGETKDKCVTYVYGNGLLYEYQTKESDREQNRQEERRAEQEEAVTGGQETESQQTAGILVHHYNNIGSTTKLTNEYGEVVEEYSYGTYGELLSGDTEQTSYLYNGMFGVATDENRLYYMRARYYNTDIKRFINRDVVKGSITNSQSLNRYSYVQGNPVSLTDPFGLSPFNWSALGHGVLTALGFIPYIGEVFDLINAAWYAKEGRYDMAVLCTIAAVPLFGSIASGALTMFKCAKIAKYVQPVTKIVSNAATFMLATGGNISSIKTIYHNIKNGEIFTKKNLYECGVIAVNTFTMIYSGKNLASSGKELGGMLKKDVSNVWSKAKGGFKNFSANNGGKESTILVTHRGTNESIAKKLEQGYLQANYPIPNTTLTRLTEHSKKAVWVSQGKPTLFNRIFSGMIGKKGEASITFKVSSDLVKTPDGYIKKWFGKAQKVIEEDILIPDDVIVKFGGNK